MHTRAFEQGDPSFSSRYGIDFLSLAAVVILTLLLQRSVDLRFFLAFTGVIVTTAWHDGFGPTTTPTILSTIACSFVLGPLITLNNVTASKAERSILFVFISFFVRRMELRSAFKTRSWQSYRLSKRLCDV